MFAIILSMFVIGCGSGTTFDAWLLRDDPESLKGKTLTARVYYEGGGLRRGDHLFSIPVSVYAKGGTVDDVRFDIPKDVKIPNIQPGELFYITFVCEEGSTSSGNVKLSRINSKLFEISTNALSPMVLTPPNQMPFWWLSVSLPRSVTTSAQVPASSSLKKLF